MYGHYLLGNYAPETVLHLYCEICQEWAIPLSRNHLAWPGPPLPIVWYSQ